MELAVLSLHTFLLYLIWKELRPTKNIPYDVPSLEFNDSLVSEFSEQSHETEEQEDLDRYVSDHISARRANNAVAMQELKEKIASYGTYDEAPYGLYNIPHEDADIDRAVRKNMEGEYAD